jgi:hypothetical protein
MIWRWAATVAAIAALAALILLFKAWGWPGTRHFAVGVAVIVLVACQWLLLAFRRWRLSLGMPVLAFALLALEALMLDPMPDCRAGCTLVVVPE